MTSFAIFRQPRQLACTFVAQTEGCPLQLASPSDLAAQQGFVVAPFAATPSEPLLIIRPDRVLTFATADDALSELGDLGCHLAGHGDNGGDGRAAYAADFATFHQALCSRRFQKLVLARSVQQRRPAGVNPLQLFARACQSYPRMFIALVSTPQSGTWLTATPELLLDASDPRCCRTIALAGTMQLTANQLEGEGERRTWSVKNIQEQRYVASFVADCLRHLAIDYREEGPRTVRAAHLLHLRSDFTFNTDVRACELLAALHPTPAVCGLPQAEARRFILSHEHTARRYYSGFQGPFRLPTSQAALLSAPPAATTTTTLYVSLRCMQILPDACLLYAGGGLLPESTEDREWQETEAKLQTMRQLLTPNS